jgi:glycerate 2-kinase
MIAVGPRPSVENGPVRVVVGPDKFKGTLTAVEAAGAMARGWLRVDPAADVDQVPVADGGEGTLEAMVAALDGRTDSVEVTGPLGESVDAELGLAETPHGLLAIVEMARASGLHLVREDRRDPLRATTFGTGELIRAACARGPRRLLVCIGGSATNDAGAGMAQALGIRLLDEDGRDLPPGGAALERLARIDLTGLDPAVREVEVVVATDVRNPLIGSGGASAVYGPQKGATPEDVALLDRALGHFAAVVHRDLGVDLRHEPGAGAAGGLGAGLVAFLGARLRPGFEVVAEALGLPRRLEAAQVAITGEGNYDRQTEFGKAPAGFLRMAREDGCRTVLIAGRVGPEVDPAADLVYSLADRAGEEAAMARAGELVEEAAAEAALALEEG